MSPPSPRRAAELGAELDSSGGRRGGPRVLGRRAGDGALFSAPPRSLWPRHAGAALRSRGYGGLHLGDARGREPVRVLRRQVGLLDAEGEAVAPLTQLAVPSSFDYANQSALYLPTGLPSPREPGFAEAVAEVIARLVEVTGGRAFALFTSLQTWSGCIRCSPGGSPTRCCSRASAGAVLLDAFQSTPSVLFASASFWEGGTCLVMRCRWSCSTSCPSPRPPTRWSPRASRRWRRPAVSRFLQLPAPGGGARAAAGIRAPHPDPDRPGHRGAPRRARREEGLRTAAARGSAAGATGSGGIGPLGEWFRSGGQVSPGSGPARSGPPCSAPAASPGSSRPGQATLAADEPPTFTDPPYSCSAAGALACRVRSGEPPPP